MRVWLFASGVMGVLIASAMPASAQKLISPPASEERAPDAAAAKPTLKDVRPGGSPIILGASGGTLLHLPGRARTVFIADPEVADVQVQSPEFVYIAAKKPGTTVLYAADELGNVLLNKAVQVQHEPITIIRGGSVLLSGQPAPGPIVLQIPLQSAAPVPAPAPAR